MSAALATKKKVKVKRYTFRGFEEEDVIDMAQDKIVEMFRSRIRRRFRRYDGIKGAYLKLLQRVIKSKQNVPAGEKPKQIKTRLRNAIIMPSMIGGIVAVYNGKEYVPVEVKFDMIGSYLGEYAITYKRVKHGKTGKGATKSSKHVD